MIQADGLQDLVDALAERLRRSVALDDRGIHLIVASRHFGDEDPVRVQSVLGREVDRSIADKILALGIDRAEGPQRIAPMPEFESKARVCVPIRCAGLLLGFLWLIDDETLGDEQIADASAVAEAAGLILYRRDLAFERRQARHDTLLRDLISTDGSARARAEEEVYDEGIIREATYSTAIVVYVPPNASEDRDSKRDEIESALAQVSRQTVSGQPDGSVLSLVRRHGLVLVFAARAALKDQVATDVSRRMVRELSSLMRQRVVAGVGMPQKGLADAHLSYEQASVSTRAAEFLPGLGDVVLWESLGVYALLAKLAPQDLSLMAYSPALARLANNRNADMLVATAETFLDLAGDAQRSAQALHIHRTTLYQRLARIEELSGLSLRDGVDRLTLHLGIKLARLTGVEQHPGW